MAKEIKTYILCYDDHRVFTEDIRKRFTDTARYTVLSFQNREEFLAHFKELKENKFCKVAILGLHDSKEQIKMIDHLTIEIKKLYPKTGLILLGPPEKMEEIKKIVKFNIDAYIPKNSNSILRIHNAVKKLISEHSIAIFRRRRNFSFYALLTFVILSVLLILISYFRFPGYF
jgi:DNA-binding NarL/FixJ family response regulator